MAPLLILLVPVALAAALGVRAWSRRQTRVRLLATPLADDQRALLARQVPLLRKLPADLRRTLEGKINLFLHQVEFQGCGGLQVTDAMRLSIAAQACLLVVNTDRWYRHLTTVMIYPGAFRSRQVEHHGYVVTERETVRVGESWTRGPVILSWEDTEHGAQDDGDGHNVVFHEFAHKLDDQTGHTDAIPDLGRAAQSYADWARVFTAAFDRHVARVETGQPTVLNAYGATRPEEYFAVAVEAFFEQPAALAGDEPEVYAQLARLFRLDPKTWA